ncbi:transporter substrate-binding domain-containing protein [Hymenobacter crusticola]|uniref:Solute-binding protein family 3/N-terminal domain-containing protein n=1 Tax=Hymenobacter crusticola TaxID=1770526 RepID=A0A243WGW6_9BACT|nr:transporter substrate-binding domain-containing protein [Hymenobacter crusticola]OUJ74993.1 hypothetical protein BXP70_08475 [Hymenobacter crusticola]
MADYLISKWSASSWLLAGALLLPACSDFPKDPEKTLKRVENGTLVVGYSENPPWVVQGNPEPTGIEPALVKAFAQTLHARVRWRKGTEQTLFEDLEKRKIDLLIAGLTDESPWKNEKAGFTRSFVEHRKKKHVMAAIQGENAFVMRLEEFLYQREAAIAQRTQP